YHLTELISLVEIYSDIYIGFRWNVITSSYCKQWFNCIKLSIVDDYFGYTAIIISAQLKPWMALPIIIDPIFKFLRYSFLIDSYIVFYECHNFIHYFFPPQFL